MSCFFFFFGPLNGSQTPFLFILRTETVFRNIYPTEKNKWVWWTISLSSLLWVVEGLILSCGGQLSNTPGTICIVWIHWGLQAETRTSVLAKRPLGQFQQCFMIQCRRWEAGVLRLFLLGDGLGFYFSGWITSLWGDLHFSEEDGPRGGSLGGCADVGYVLLHPWHTLTAGSLQMQNKSVGGN